MWYVKLKKLTWNQLVDPKQPIRLKFYHYSIYGIRYDRLRIVLMAIFNHSISSSSNNTYHIVAYFS